MLLFAGNRPPAHLGVSVPDVSVAVIDTGEHPWLCEMELDTLHALGPRCELLLDLDLHRLN